MHILSAAQTREWDAFTIQHEPILSIDLMERAARQLTAWFVQQYPPPRTVHIYCGAGNNGGDGLAMARMLAEYQYELKVFQLAAEKYSDDNAVNRKRLVDDGTEIIWVKTPDDFTDIPAKAIVIDALFGNGLNRELKDLPAQWIKHLNQSGAEVVSIDLPSGLMADDFTESLAVVKATHTLALQTVKPALLMPESEKYTGTWEVINIGLHNNFLQKTAEPYRWITSDDVSAWQPIFGKHAHKGERGHALLFAGSLPMMGAAVLCTRSCTRSGAGLITTATVETAWMLIQQSSPMAICALPGMAIRPQWMEERKVKAIGIGPGLIYDEDMLHHLEAALDTNLPLVIDATALHGLPAVHESLHRRRAPTILTPHVGEFDRITGTHSNNFDRLKTAIEIAASWHVIIVLKGAYTRVVCPDGSVYFNSSGNPGMAKGGSGDVLCGLITGMLAQGMDGKAAACSAVYIHGLAGDLAAKNISQHAMLPTDIIAKIQDAFTETGWN